MRLFEGVAALAPFLFGMFLSNMEKFLLSVRGKENVGYLEGLSSGLVDGSVLLILLVKLFYLWVWQVAIINGRCEAFMHGHLLRLILAGF